MNKQIIKIIAIYIFKYNAIYAKRNLDCSEAIITKGERNGMGK